MNLQQMQMAYQADANGKLVLKSKRIDFLNLCQVRDRQGQTRAKKADYRPRRFRPPHDNAWK